MNPPVRLFSIAVLLGFSMGLGCGPSGDDSVASPVEPQWWPTCGDPVCNEYTGPWPGVPLCADEGVVSGDPCDIANTGNECDPVDPCNARLRCADDDPSQQPGGCPISRARHKEHIEYLDPAALRHAARQVHQMKLATWRYTGELDDGRAHLGFIIDDLASSPAVRPDGEHVDLYGYTSLAVAAIQQQQARIEALEARLAEIERDCRPHGE